MLNELCFKDVYFPTGKRATVIDVSPTYVITNENEYDYVVSLLFDDRSIVKFALFKALDHGTFKFVDDLLIIEKVRDEVKLRQTNNKVTSIEKLINKLRKKKRRKN